MNKRKGERRTGGERECGREAEREGRLGGNKGKEGRSEIRGEKGDKGRKGRYGEKRKTMREEGREDRN